MTIILLIAPDHPNVIEVISGFHIFLSNTIQLTVLCLLVYLRTPFTFTSEIRSRILRSTCPLQLYSPKPRSELYTRSFQYPGVSIWNNLPVHVRHSTSVNVFKARYLKWVQNQGLPE